MKKTNFYNNLKLKFNLIITLLIGLFALFSAYANIKADAKTQKALIPIEITKIVDGDTVRVKIDENEFPVRLVGIDCFESSKSQRAYKQAYIEKLTIDEVVKRGKESQNFLQTLYDNSSKNAYLDFKGLDRYNRALGIIYLDNQNLNDTLRQNGGCMVYIYK